MLIRFDPFRDFDRLAQEAFGTAARQSMMPMDAYRAGDEFVIHFDLPGVDPSSIDLTVEKDVLNVSAERSWQPDDSKQVLVSERRQGRFTRQLLLGDSLDADRVEADYRDGVLTVRLPVAEQAKPRKVSVTARNGEQAAIDTGSRDRS